ncbi:MAG: homocysteine S-methyltransferase family protein [Ignavibacteria bacterium]
MEQRDIIILDSAMGTELQSRGMDISLPLWSAKPLIDNPDSVRQIHIDNVDAGADIITTNTFRTQKRTLQKAKYKFEKMDYSETAKKLTESAVRIAKDAVTITEKDVLIAGSIAPLEDCYHPELVPDDEALKNEHSEHYNNLVSEEVDIILAETLSSIREISAVLKILSNGEKEFCFSLLCKNEISLFSGESLEDAVKLVNSYSPSALLINCIHPSLAISVISHLKDLADLPLGIYANVGNPKDLAGSFVEKTVSVNEYFEYAKNWKKLGVKMIGGCCGTSPEYIKKISVLK